MAEALQFEALPQRAPKGKRKRRKESVADDKPAKGQNGSLAPPPAAGPEAAAESAELASSTAPDSSKAGGKEPSMPQKPDAAEPPISEEAQEYRAAAEPGQKFEYLDHTADVQLHAWGENLQEAFENVGLCMFNYMTPLKGIAPTDTRTYSAEGHDLSSLLYHWLDELLFGFATDFFVPSSLRITSFNREAWRIEAEGIGEAFDRQRHVCGTEIKAITYSAMQINESKGDAEVFVIVDI